MNNKEKLILIKNANVFKKLLPKGVSFPPNFKPKKVEAKPTTFSVGNKLVSKADLDNYNRRFSQYYNKQDGTFITEPSHFGQGLNTKRMAEMSPKKSDLTPFEKQRLGAPAANAVTR